MLNDGINCSDNYSDTFDLNGHKEINQHAFLFANQSMEIAKTRGCRADGILLVKFLNDLCTARHARLARKSIVDGEFQSCSHVRTYTYINTFIQFIL